MPLCWECREWLIIRHGNGYYVAPYQHCHHDQPEKKPLLKCQWCEDYSRFWQYQKLNIFSDLWRIAHNLLTVGEPLTNCPMCGVKVKGE